MVKVKVGEKGRHVELPEGFCRVIAGRPVVGDLYLRCPHYDRWLRVEPEDCDMNANEFDCLIRRMEKPQ